MNYKKNIQPNIFPINKLSLTEPVLTNLNNGVPVYQIESGSEDIVRLEFAFRAGQIKENIPLLASTTNSMLTEGSANYTSEELNHILDFYGAFVNPYYDKDHASVVFFILNKHLEKILELSREILFAPIFPENELNALMKNRFQWYMVNREKVNNRANDLFFESAFGKNHPYGRQVTEDDFKNITQNSIIDFHKNYYSHNNMAVIISGKIPGITISLLNRFFGETFTESRVEDHPDNTITDQDNQKLHIKKKGSIQTAIRIGSTTINKRNPDYTGLKVLDSLLGGYFGSRLMKNIREEKGYTYGINSCISSLDLSGYKLISTEVSRKNVRHTIEEIYREISNLQKIPVEKGELTVVKNYMLGEMLRMFDGPFALADSFKAVWEYGLDNNYYRRLAEKIRTIDQDEIILLAKKYYNIDELHEITYG
jgi:zinc protease